MSMALNRLDNTPKGQQSPEFFHPYFISNLGLIVINAVSSDRRPNTRLKFTGRSLET
jgi:hypothetical protein